MDRLLVEVEIVELDNELCITGGRPRRPLFQRLGALSPDSARFISATEGTEFVAMLGTLRALSWRRGGFGGCRSIVLAEGKAVEGWNWRSRVCSSDF